MFLQLSTGLNKKMGFKTFIWGYFLKNFNVFVKRKWTNIFLNTSNLFYSFQCMLPFSKKLKTQIWNLQRTQSQKLLMCSATDPKTFLLCRASRGRMLQKPSLGWNLWWNSWEITKKKKNHYFKASKKFFSQRPQAATHLNLRWSGRFRKKINKRSK